MTLRSIELLHLRVPLKRKIAHASHERTDSDNLVVRATLADGTAGYGEGVPRPYVTGETIESGFRMLRGCDAAQAVGAPTSFAEAVRRLAAFDLPENRDDPRGMAANAARCALELALLDAYGRHFGVPLGDAVRIAAAGQTWLAPEACPVRYSGAITTESPRKQRISAWKMRIYGFAHVKVKVGLDGIDEPAQLRRMRWILGSKVDVRLDANEAWHAGELVERVRPLLPSRPSVLEQPVPHAEVDTLADLRPKLGVPVMLDESLCGLPDGQRAIREGLTDFFNVRLSKCGGLLPSLRLVDLAFSNGLRVQLGCHPGETGILSAAGRHFASHVNGLSYIEGSYDRHVLAANVIAEDITFNYGGRARPLEGPGLGVTVVPERLEALAVTREVIDYA